MKKKKKSFILTNQYSFSLAQILLDELCLRPNLTTSLQTILTQLTRITNNVNEDDN